MSATRSEIIMERDEAMDSMQLRVGAVLRWDGSGIEEMLANDVEIKHKEIYIDGYIAGYHAAQMSPEAQEVDGDVIRDGIQDAIWKRQDAMNDIKDEKPINARCPECGCPATDGRASYTHGLSTAHEQIGRLTEALERLRYCEHNGIGCCRNCKDLAASTLKGE
jgi:hypothetical protein